MFVLRLLPLDFILFVQNKNGNCKDSYDRYRCCNIDLTNSQRFTTNACHRCYSAENCQRHTKGMNELFGSFSKMKLLLSVKGHWVNSNRDSNIINLFNISDVQVSVNKRTTNCWAIFKDETSNWLGLCHMYNVFYSLLSTSYSRKLVYQLRTNATES